MSVTVNSRATGGSGGTQAALAASESTSGLAVITGTPAVGNVLTATTTHGLIGTSWQWRNNGVDIGGATAQTYTVQSTDQGDSLTVFINGILLSTAVFVPLSGVLAALIGGNVGASQSYAPNPHYQNAVFDSRVPTLQNGSPMMSFDSNGWPAVASQIVISALPAGLSSGGQLAPGTYHCTVVSPTGGYCTPSIVNGTAGNFINNIANQGDNATTTFDLHSDATTNLVMNLSTAISSLDIPRDGSSSSAGKGWWYAPGVAMHARLQSLRFLDFMGTNGKTETNWGARPAGPSSAAAYVQGSAPALTSWELWCDYCNTVYTYPGSKLQQVWLNISGYVGTVLATAAADAAGYGTGLATLLNSYPLNSGLKVRIEFGNEPWNPGFTLLNDYIKFALNELQVVTNYAGTSFGGGTPNTVTSVVGNGTTATVTASGTIPAWVSNGATCFASTSTNTFQGGSIASPVAIASVTNIGGTSYTFTYPCSSSGTMSGSFQCIFNTTSTLVTDGSTNVVNLFNAGPKFMVRGVFRIQQAWAAVRPQDKFLLNIQAASYSSNGLAPMNFPPLHFQYANYLGGGSGSGGDTTHAKTWLPATACAPYISAQGTGAINSGSNQLTSFNLATAMRVGDTLVVRNAGDTTQLVSPIIAINGTSVSLRNNTNTAATGVTVTCSKGSSTGSMLANQNVVTGVSIAGLVVGDILTVPTANNPALCAIVTDISAAGSGTLTLDTNAARTVTTGSPGNTALTDCDPLSIIAAMTLNIGLVTEPTVRNHVYMNLKYGLTPIFYEGGPDTQTAPLKQIEVNTNPAIGTMVSAHMDKIFQGGGSDYHFFEISPGNYIDLFGDFSGNGYTTSQDSWYACQTFTDNATAAPKLWAVTGYVYPNSFTNVYGNPGTVTVATMAEGNGTLNGVTGLYYFTPNSILRYSRSTITVNATRVYTIAVWLADNTGTAASVYIDGVLVGTSTITAGANLGSSNSAVATAGSTFTTLLSAGPHLLSIEFPIGIGNTPGLQQTVFT